MRPKLLLTVAALGLLAMPVPARAQIIPPATCAEGSASALLGPDESMTAHFVIRAATAPPAEYGTTLEAAYERQITDYGWVKPRTTRSDGRLPVVVAGSPAGGGKVGTTGDDTNATPGNNPNSSWEDGDAVAPCLWLATGLSGNGLQGVVAREFNNMILHGIGALTPVDETDPVFKAAGPKLMEEETFPAANTAHDDLYPKLDDSLGAYDDTPTLANQWLALRGLTERFGADSAGGGEDVMQEFWQRTSQGTQRNLDALDGALTTKKGITLAQAFHDYAVAARAMLACPPGAYPYCFKEAAGYAAAGARPDHKTISAIPGETSGQIEDNYAIQWIKLPTSGRFDLVVQNLAAAGVIAGTATCVSGSAVVRVALPSTVTPNSSRGLFAFPPAGCTSPALVLSSASRTAADPTTSVMRSYRVALTPATALLTVSLTGNGFGAAASTPDGISCPTDCAERFPIGSLVTLRGAAVTGSRFDGWSGACTATTLECTFSVTADATATASYTLAPVVNPSQTGTGTGTGAGTNLSYYNVPQKPVGIVGDTTAPRILIDRLRRSRDGRSLSLRVRCPVTEPNRCTGFVTLTSKARRKRLKLGDSGFIRLAAGKSVTLKYKLTKRTRTAIKGLKRLTIKAAARTRDDAFNYSRQTKSFRLKLPVKKAKKKK